MDEQQERLIEIFGEARAKGSAAEREAYVRAACGDDAALRRQVEALLRADEKAGDFLKRSVAPAGGDMRVEACGSFIGHYKLLEQIGEGGFGVVYLAEQTEPVQRKVALKIIKAGMDTREVIARFEAERQALALMDHPNIAKVLDAGATDAGRPYFVMELVNGLPITDYADQYNLSTEERLHLFMQVCHGVQHAHQKSIIHRDLKPSNILVTVIDGEPVPKIIDFGVVKALGQRLTDKTLFTASEQIIGTPAYMSPEQAELSGVDIDTRSDIYALGVLLYELLTGVTPFDQETLRQAALDEVRRIIRETEPPKPSTRLHTLGERLTEVAKHRQTEPATLNRLVHGDLDWIVMKALEKDRRRRYETAGALAEDLQRHHDHQPVQAGPPSAAYRARKFVRRHRFGVAIATSVALALAAGLTAALMGFGRASRERDRALAAEAQAQQQQVRAEQLARQESTQRQRAERTLIRMELQRAEDAFEADNPSVGLAYLAWVLRKDPTNQGAAERILSALTYRNFPLPLFEPLQHSGPVRSALFSARGDRIVTASSDGTARVWDARTGQALLQPLAHEAEVSYAEFSPDGQRLLTVSSNLCRLWNARTGRDSGVSITHQGIVCTARFSPDGKKVVTASADGTARISDAESGQMLAGPLQHKAAVSSADFSPDGRAVLTTSSDKTTRLWDARTGQPLTEPLVHEAPVRFGWFSADGRWVVTAAHQSALLWDAATGLPVGKPFAHEGEFRTVYSAQLSPGGRRLLTALANSTAKIWDVASGGTLVPALRHHGPVTDAQFAPNGWTAVTASRDSTARLWRSDTGLPATVPIQHYGAVVSARFSPDDKCVLTASADGTARLWDACQGAAAPIMLNHEFMRAYGAEFSPDGRWVVTTSDDVGRSARLWDARTGRPVSRPLKHDRSVYAAQFSPDGRCVVTASLDSTARVWDARTGEPVTGPLYHQPALRSQVRSARFSPDGRRVITGTGAPDSSARIWSVEAGGQLLHTLKHNNTVWTAQFSPDARRVLTASADGTAVVWDADTGHPLIKPMRHRDQVYYAEFSPDGQRIVTASFDGTARVWGATTGEPLTRPMRHGERVWSAEFSPDGLLVATASSDNTARVWDARTGEPRTDPLRHSEVVWTAQFSPDGQRVLTASVGGNGWVWDVRTGFPVSEPLASGGHARFSPDGQCAIAGLRRSVRIWNVPSAPLPIAPWLPLLAEAVGHQRFRDNGALEFVPLTNILALKRSILAGAENDSYTQWAKWFFADRTTRTISPFSSVPVTNSIRWLLEQVKYPETSVLRNLDVQSATDMTLNNLAWALATHTDSQVRDGQSAVALAEIAVAVTGRTNAMYLDTLAAACAEAGRFDQAINLQQEAIALLDAKEDKRGYESHLRLYQAGSPVRE